jgi:hypothetical protein
MWRCVADSYPAVGGLPQGYHIRAYFEGVELDAIAETALLEWMQHRRAEFFEKHKREVSRPALANYLDAIAAVFRANSSVTNPVPAFREGPEVQSGANRVLTLCDRRASIEQLAEPRMPDRPDHAGLTSRAGCAR